jgi:hypothetical protein
MRIGKAADFSQFRGANRLSLLFARTGHLIGHIRAFNRPEQAIVRQ